MKNKLNAIILFLSFTLLFFVLSRASLLTEIMPFAFPMLFALAWANQKVWIISPAYFVGFVINNHSFEDIIICIVTILALVIPYYIHVVIKKPLKKYELFIYTFLSQIAYIIFAVLGDVNIIPGK